MKSEIATIILPFLRIVLSVDLLIAALTGFACYLLELRSPAAYGTVLVWVGAAIILIAALIGVGGFASRGEDAIAYSRTGAGNMIDNLQRISDARSSNLGCFIHMIAVALALIGFGNLIQIIPILF